MFINAFLTELLLNTDSRFLPSYSKTLFTSTCLLHPRVAFSFKCYQMYNLHLDQFFTSKSIVYIQVYCLQPMNCLYPSVLFTSKRIVCIQVYC